MRVAAVLALPALVAPTLAFSPPASAKVAPAQLVEAPAQHPLFAAASFRYYPELSWRALFGGSTFDYYDGYQRLTWPDASMWTLGAYYGWSSGPNGTHMASIDPWGATVGSRHLDDARNRGWVLAAGRREWSLREVERIHGTTAQLASWGSDGRLRSTRTFPKGRRPAAIVPTSHGIRVVVNARPGLRLLDQRLHTRATAALPKGFGVVDPQAVQPLADGSVVVPVRSGTGDHEQRLVRMRDGHPSRTIWRGPALMSLQRVSTGLLGFGASRRHTRTVSVDEHGRVRTLRDSKIGLPRVLAACPPSQFRGANSVVATSGRALLTLGCRGSASNPIAAAAVVEFDGRGRARRAYDLTSSDPADSFDRLVSSDTMPDGSLPFPNSRNAEEDRHVSTGWSTWLPTGSRQARRGDVSGRLIGSGDDRQVALVRVTCRAPYGQRCSGTAELRDGAQLVGVKHYSLPGRPGASAAEDEFAVTLSRAVRTGSLRTTVSALPPRPFLDPPHPAWDRSIE